MDIFNIGSLIARGRILYSADLDPATDYVQVGKLINKRDGNTNTYESFAVPLNQLLGKSAITTKIQISQSDMRQLATLNTNKGFKVLDSPGPGIIRRINSCLLYVNGYSPSNIVTSVRLYSNRTSTSTRRLLMTINLFGISNLSVNNSATFRGKVVEMSEASNNIGSAPEFQRNSVYIPDGSTYLSTPSDITDYTGGCYFNCRISRYKNILNY